MVGDKQKAKGGVRRALGNADSPGALILPIASLDDLMLSGEDLLLKNLCAAALVDTGNLEDLGRVYIGVGTPSHYRDAANHALIDLYASVAVS